jgi:hypothetical protein
MKRATTLSASVAAAVCLLCLGFASSSGAEPAKDDTSKKAAPATGDANKDKALTDGKTKGSAPAKNNDDGQITIADWLDVGGKVVDAANELFAFRHVPARAAAAPALAADNLKAFENQYGRRFQQLYRSELHLMRVVCQPTRGQFDKIAAGGAPELRVLASRCADIWNGRRNAPLPADNPYPDLHKLVAAAIVKAAKPVLSAEQVTRYQQELDRRDAARRRVILANLVAATDRQLILTVEQRGKLTEVLDKSWQPWWDRAFVLMSRGDYVPVLSDDKILPILTEQQKVVWRTIRKGNIFRGFELDWFQDVDIGDEVWPAARDTR